ncbi:class I SAM-dependent methyltransferase [Desulfovibrio litoralis]|uniref:Predicted SAM-depedendent methyltransferase n=1 Tax=Desulfovibrio litoralis DSM 11393 TaxID=1121455 RepID=A0A1M7TQP7_9BACT|nr:methyltransferase domain-containing protein [Desulfovibrio litoralis]SHN72988.1 Predicted SAM-depedendent methyltransferase [Desulfovibrio litoralis DSM 11393]
MNLSAQQNMNIDKNQIDQNDTRIPCVVLVFFDFEIIKKSLDFVTQYSDRLAITVVENCSQNTATKIKPYIEQLLKAHKIERYILFDENISSNAFDVVVDQKLFYDTQSPYLMVTDGDLTIEDKNWLDEQVAIIEQNPEVFAVGLELDLVNLPQVSGAETWVPAATPIQDKNYNLGDTGFWFVLSRKAAFLKACNVILHENKLRFLDSIFCDYSREQEKKWVRTKKAKAYHLTWDVYKTPGHSYRKIRESKKDPLELFIHNRYCNYTIYSPLKKRERNIVDNSEKSIITQQKIVISEREEVSLADLLKENRKNAKVLLELCKAKGYLLKLHLGCGTVYHKGWINIDNNSDNNINELDLHWDLRYKLPFPDNSVDFVFHEHFLEHLTVQEALSSLKDTLRVLKPGGVLRVAMPDLRQAVSDYLNPVWKDLPWLKQYGLTFVQTKAELMNMNFRAWGHQYLYDDEELLRRLQEAGFEKIKICPWHQSEHAALVNLETREQSTLVAEATK